MTNNASYCLLPKHKGLSLSLLHLVIILFPYRRYEDHKLVFVRLRVRLPSPRAVPHLDDWPCQAEEGQEAPVVRQTNFFYFFSPSPGC